MNYSELDITSNLASVCCLNQTLVVSDIDAWCLMESSFWLNKLQPMACLKLVSRHYRTEQIPLFQIGSEQLGSMLAFMDGFVHIFPIAEQKPTDDVPVVSNDCIIKN